MVVAVVRVEQSRPTTATVSGSVFVEREAGQDAEDAAMAGSSGYNHESINQSTATTPTPLLSKACSIRPSETEASQSKFTTVGSTT
jgi:hypothetical protein